MDINRPNSAECQQPSQGFERESHDKRRQVDESHCINSIQRMLSMSSEPIEVFRAVMNRMKAPKEGPAMLKPMPPIHQHVAQHDHFHALQPPWLGGNKRPVVSRH